MYGFEIGDRVKLSPIGLKRKVAKSDTRGVVTGHDRYGCVLVNIARTKRKVIWPFKPEFLEKEI